VRRLLWSPRALALYERDVLDHLDKQGESVMRRVRSDIERAIQVLAQRPIGRPGRISGTYEKSVVGQPYVIAYTLLPREDGAADDVVILRIVHTSRDWPPGHWPR
jgi:plasmid stabilization system protein ParE